MDNAQNSSTLPRKPVGGICRVRLASARAFSPQSRFAEYELIDDRSAYVETLTADEGLLRVRHTLTLVFDKHQADAWFDRRWLERCATDGVVAAIETAAGERLRIGRSDRFGCEQALRLERFTFASGPATARRRRSYLRARTPTGHKQIPTIMKKIKPKTALAVGNRTDPYLTLGAGTVQSDRFWRWGDDNLFPAALALMSRRSTTHRRIINDKADYISGKGVVCDTASPLLARFIETVNGDGESLRQLLNKLAYDKSLFGNAFLEVVTDARRSFLSLYHQDASRCRLAKDSAHVLLHHDWAAFRAEEARTLPLYPSFEEQADGTLRAAVHYKDYEPMFTHYGVPPYIAGFGVSAIAYKTDRWNISRLDNSFQLSGVMMLDSTVDSEAEAERVVRTAEERFAGNPGQVMFVLKEGSENDHSRFIPIASQNDGDWKALHDQAVSDIVVAHSWFRSLSGLDYASGFSAERILHEYEVALNTVILGEQAELLEPIRALLRRTLGVDAASLQIVNRPPTRSKPLYMKVWEARKADGLDYDPDDERQQRYLSEITRYNLTHID